jgi:prepilin-type N-terminal cleavage/methylation domain-containing protein
MIHFKNSSGFTLVEVVLSLMIMGLVYGSVYVSQGSAIRVVKVFALRLSRLLAAKELLIEMTTGKEGESAEQVRKDKQLKEDGPVTHLTYTQEPAASGAIKDFKDIVVQKVKAEWQEDRSAHTELLVTFAFKPKKEKKES